MPNVAFLESRDRRTMKDLHTAILCCVLAFTMVGCAIPTGRNETSGHRHSKSVLVMLEEPGTTREDVVDNFGPPLMEYEKLNVLAYAWSEAMRYQHIHEKGASYGKEQLMALFIEFDSGGYVVAYGERPVESQSLEEACRRWYATRNQ